MFCFQSSTRWHFIKAVLLLWLLELSAHIIILKGIVLSSSKYEKSIFSWMIIVRILKQKLAY